MAPRTRLTGALAAVATTLAAGIALALLVVPGTGEAAPPAPAITDDAFRITGTSDTSDTSGGPSGTEAADPDERVAPTTSRSRRTTLLVPRIGLRVAVVPGVDEDALARGVGTWPNGVGPGDRGNYVLAGHRVTHGEPFADLPRLRAGDTVTVEQAGYRFVYRMDTDGDAYRVHDDDLWPVAPVPRPMRGGPDRVLTLITCAETFHTDDRYVAFGHLERMERAGRAGRVSAPSR